MRRVFIDTGAFVALRNRSEQEHALARATAQDLIRAGVRFFTSNYVFAETYTALMVRIDREEAIRWGQRFREGEGVELVRIDQGLEDDAWSILESHTDKTWSYVDATSFALMASEGVAEVFAFDHNFAQRGLRMFPL